MPLEKESLNNFLPNGFETLNQEGYKENFAEDKIATGYERDVPDIVSGPNLNNLLDNIGKNTNVLTKFMDFIKNMPINNLFVVDENNQLVYKNLNEVGGGGLEIGDIGIAPLGIDETKNKRRYLNGQIIIQEQFLSFTTKIKTAINLYPTLSCSEEEWQATALLTVGGQVGKFVVDDDAGTIRLPKIIMPIQGLTDLSKLAEIVEAGLPNITGTIGTWSRNYFETIGAFYNSYTTGAGQGGSGSGGSNMRYDFSASRSNPIYSKSDTVQQEQIQYPYFIQVATGAETKEYFENEHLLNTPFFIGYSQYFENAPYNLSWAVGGTTLTRKVHPAYYDALLIELNADIEVGTTQNNYTKRGLPVKLATDSDITDYDFIVNTAEETFILPLLNGEESLPSDDKISQTILASGESYTAPQNGWFSCLVVSSVANGTVNLYCEETGLAHLTQANSNMASRGSIPVSKGDVVNYVYPTNSTNILFFVPAKGNGSLYYYVGETVENANLINAGRIEEKLVNKADTNASNFTTEGKSLISGYGMPSNKYIDLTLGASGTTYTAPANGYFYFYAIVKVDNCSLLLDNTSALGLRSHIRVPKSTADGSVFMLAQKGDTVQVAYGNSLQKSTFRFIYAQGEA